MKLPLFSLVWRVLWTLHGERQSDQQHTWMERSGHPTHAILRPSHSQTLTTTIVHTFATDFRDFSSTPPGDCVCNTFCAGKVVSTVYVGDKRERKSKEDRKRVIVYTLCKGSAGRERKKGCGPCTRWQWFPWPPCRAKWRHPSWGCLGTPAMVFAGVGSSKREQYIN